MVDLSPWNVASTFSLDEAAALIAGIEPEAPESARRIKPIRDRLSKAYQLALDWHVNSHHPSGDQPVSDSKDECSLTSVAMADFVESIDSADSSRVLTSVQASDSAETTGVEQLVCSPTPKDGADAPQPFISPKFTQRSHATFRFDDWLNDDQRSNADAQKFNRRELNRWLGVNGIHSAYKFEVNVRARTVLTGKEVDPRERESLLNIIGALLDLLVAQQTTADGRGDCSQAEIINRILKRYKDMPGISKRNLEKYFAAANRSLNKP